MREHRWCSAESSNGDAEETTEAGAKGGVISPAWSGAGISRKVWELRDWFLRGEMNCICSSGRWEKARGLETTCFTWGSCE